LFADASFIVCLYGLRIPPSRFNLPEFGAAREENVLGEPPKVLCRNVFCRDVNNPW
jgi:hypothetical protein